MLRNYLLLVLLICVISVLLTVDLDRKTLAMDPGVLLDSKLTFREHNT